VAYNTISSIECDVGYSPLLFTGATHSNPYSRSNSNAGGIWGCYACGNNVISCTTSLSTTSTSTGNTLSSQVCKDGFY